MAALLSILWVVLGISLMLLLNLKFKINSMVALLLAAILVGVLAGMNRVRGVINLRHFPTSTPTASTLGFGVQRRSTLTPSANQPLAWVASL